MADWDVFVSYTHSDQAAASRIQAFLEDYPLPGKRRALRVFRDKTDLRAGELGRSIPREIGNARILMLCCSPAAAKSGWVSREVAAFDSAHGTAAPIVPLLLDGEPSAVVPQVLSGREALILDLRAGWLLGRPRGTTRVELLRALAAAADVPLRELIPWDAARRRRRWTMVAAAVAVAVAAIATTGTSAWMTQREADAAALRREAETAALRIETGDVAEGVAALGHALARDQRGILSDGLEIFRHWLPVLPVAEETARAERGLLKIGGRIYARGASSDLVAMDVTEPFVAVAPWPGRIVTAGAGGILVINATTGAREAEVTLPPGTEIVGLHAAHKGGALVVLGRMIRIDNDEDKPSVPIPCTALLTQGKPESVPKDAQVAVRIVTSEGEQVKMMRPLPKGDLFWHDCVEERAQPEPQAETATPTPRPAPAISITLDVPRIPEGDDAAAHDVAAWDESMRQAWPGATQLPLVTLPALRPEHALWRAADKTPFEPPKRLGTARSMDEAAVAALGLEEVEQGQSVFGEVVELAGFEHAGGRVFWGINVCGNSFVCVVRCAAPASGKVSACKGDVSLSALNAWQVFSPDARRFAHLSRHMAEPLLTVFDVADYARRAPDRQPAAPIVTAAFTADNTHLVVLTTADQLVVYAIGDDGTPRQARLMGLRQGRAEERCTGRERVVARHGPQVAVLSVDCTLQLLDVAAGRLLWRTRLDVDTQTESTTQLVVTGGGRTLALVAGGKVRIVHADTGAALSAPLDPADLAGVRREDAGAVRLVTHAGDGAPALDVGGQLFVRSAPLSAEAAGAVLRELDRYTLISTKDGRTPLDRLPGR